MLFCQKTKTALLQFYYSLQFATGNVEKAADTQSTISNEAELAQVRTPDQMWLFTAAGTALPLKS